MSTTRTDRQAKSLAEARTQYQKLHKQIENRMDAIRDHLRENHIEDTLHWGHVGDLGHVNELLGEIAMFLGIEKEKS